MDNQVLFLILKENLPPHLYYILYYRLIRGENETLEAIANKFKLTRERIRQLGNKALNKIKPFFDENSKQYAEVRRKIENKYGRDLYRRSIEPIEPIDAVKYLYIKDELNDLEKDFEVDGGINEETAKEAVEAGADILVIGSALLKAENQKEFINNIKSL